VRSGKSVHSFCTSSERIIRHPRRKIGPAPPPSLGPIGAGSCQESASGARRF